MNGLRQEYLICNFPLSRFLYVRDTLTKEQHPSFVIVASQNVVLEDVSTTPNASLGPQDAEVVKRNSRNSIQLCVAVAYGWRSARQWTAK